MTFTRRQFVKGGVTAFTFGFAAPQALCDIAFAQGVPSRNLVVVYLGGGNDSLSTVIPYRDSFYYSRRPTLAVPAANVLQIGRDASGIELGLHPRLTGLKSIFDSGRLAIVQRTGYANQSRSHFTGFDIWGTASTQNTSGTGWLGRYLDTISNPDPLVAWNTQRETPRPLIANRVGVPAITSPAAYSFSSPNSGAEAGFERTAQTRISSHLPVDRPHLAFVNSTTQAAMATLDRVATVATYRPANAYPNNGFGQALTAVAGAMNKQIGTKVFWVQTGGYDTHASQGVNQANGAYSNLMGVLDGGLKAFHDDLQSQGLLNNTLILIYTEFGRRITENGSQGTDHGAGGNMMVLGGMVRGGLFGTAPMLSTDPANPTLENSAGDVRFETDFRSVYAKILDNWLGADSVSVLGADYRNGAPNIL
ncbi:MAG TPA: DUF1501 domain-containing protein [Vicinamibacterales bacterium]|nr:DUF1501 domain-containing protein [Vicinamibacterales bacterium]